MIKVLVLFSGCGIGGAEKSLTRMVNSNNDKSIDYQVATFATAGDWSKWAKELKLQPICFDNKFFSLIKHIRQNNYNFIYIIGFRLSIYLRFTRFLFPKIKLIQGIRWDVSGLPTKLTKWFKIFETNFSFLIDGYITNTHIAKKSLIDYGVKKNNIIVIHNGIEVLELNKKAHNEIKQVLTIANFFPVKGHIDYLQVIKKVIQQIANVEFLLVGRDEMNGKVEKEIKRLNLTKSIKCLPFQEASNLFQTADIFVLPSLSEGFPTVLLETFSYKLPVIAYKVGGIPELVEDGQDGFLCDKNDTTAMANNIIELLNNSKKAKQFGDNGYQKVKKIFTIEKMVEKHNQYFIN